MCVFGVKVGGSIFGIDDGEECQRFAIMII